jgi:hypothetical protein
MLAGETGISTYARILRAIIMKYSFGEVCPLRYLRAGHFPFLSSHMIPQSGLIIVKPMSCCGVSFSYP